MSRNSQTGVERPAEKNLGAICQVTLTEDIWKRKAIKVPVSSYLEKKELYSSSFLGR